MATAANDMPKQGKACYSTECGAETLALIERFGVAAAASELDWVLPNHCGRFR